MCYIILVSVVFYFINYQFSICLWGTCYNISTSMVYYIPYMYIIYYIIVFLGKFLKLRLWRGILILCTIVICIYLYKILHKTYLTGIPLFVYTALLLYFTVFCSVLFYQYLTLYGIFFLNFSTLTLFWLSLMYYIPYIFLNQKTFTIFFNKWLYINIDYKIDFYIIIDFISYSFMLLTTSIAVFVFLYAFSYFRYEPLVDRFILFLMLFVISMLFLVASGNLIMLFLGWELIGLTSFLLINFWVTKIGTLKAAFKAFTFNKISDFWLLLFLLLVFGLYYDFDIIIINNEAYLYFNSNIRLLNLNINFSEILCVLLLFAAFIKSAQFGMHIWLPDSMEAPVPASSLIHSATLVSAGIFLVLRFNSLFDNSILAKYLLVFIGSLTAAYGGVAAANQPDVKRILAYSTISHCGFLMVLCFTQINEFTILYLYVHGFFKACVFMCIGNIIRISKNYQDFRRMGMYWKYLPFESLVVFFGLVNLCGLPFSIGFLIKHILLLSLHTNIFLYYLVLFFCIVGAIFGLFYSYRVYFNVFFDFKKGKKSVYQHLNKLPLSSLYYSNTSIASNFSIFGLFIVSYIISYVLFMYFLNIGILFSDCFNSNIYSNFGGYFNTYVGALLNFTILNLIILFFITVLIFSHFRQTNKLYNIIYLLVVIILLTF